MQRKAISLNVNGPGHFQPNHFRWTVKSTSKATDRACPEPAEGSVRSARVGMASGEQQIPRSSSPLRGCERTRNDKGFFLSPVRM
jgi:hypothetical protein